MGRALRWVAYVVGGILGVLVLALVVIYGVSEWKLRKDYNFQVAEARVSADEETTARGEHLANAVLGCTDCHGLDLSGTTMIDDPMVGRIDSANITTVEGGIQEHYTDTDLVRVLRYGVSNEGRGLLFMGNQHLTESDALAVVAYLRTVPPVEREHPGNRIGPLGRFGYLVGMFGDIVHAETVDPDAPWPDPVEPAVTVEYGEYLANVAGCTSCHGANLEGGKNEGGPDDPPAADLTASGHTADWTIEDFISTIRTGTNPSGHVTDEFMPSKFYANMTDEELQAIWIFVRETTNQEQ